MNPHEELLIRSFVIPGKRKRYLGFLENYSRRNKLLQELPHQFESDLIEKYRVPVPVETQTPEKIHALLTQLGAPKLCYLISESPSLDQQDLDLKQALESILGCGMGSVLSCIPGKLAYYEGEFNSRYILQRIN